MSKIIKAQNEKFLKLLCIIKKIAETTVQRRKNSKRGRPRKFSLFQIIACLVYKVKRGIASFRELEYRINQDTEFKKSIGLEKSPDYSYIAKLAAKIEEDLLQAIRDVLIAEINPDVSITIVDSTPLRSSKQDKEAKIGIHVTIGFYKGYKLHLLCTGKEEVLPLFWILTTANKHDSTQEELLVRSMELQFEDETCQEFCVSNL
uniref:transposase n=1 Tax=Caldicellulosiruptor obsidiansis TaxID=717609 RepID=UPI0002E01C4D|nr:transposase [Caldicellulosiruptor obsidiansis]